MMQKYKFFQLFIIILNCFLLSCNSDISTGTQINQTMNEKKKPEAGDVAPEFSLTDQHGKLFSLKDFRGSQYLVLFFYPKDDSYGCTKEACSFRDQYEDFKDAGAEVVGVSSDDGASHRNFAGKHRLPFRLLSDQGGKVASLYGISKTLGVLPGRVTFVIDPHGIIVKKFDSQFRFGKHVEEALEILKGKPNL
jgi:peroxiredoxin Q/BCP